jgi:hypothetical protein
MSESKPTPQITQRHYQAVGGLALAAIFLLQLQQVQGTDGAALVANLFMLFLGVLSLLYRFRLSPMLVLGLLVLPILIEQYNRNQFNLDIRSFHGLEVTDIMLCVATLTYLIAQYRLHGLRFGVLPPDSRLSAEQAARSETSLSTAELLGLIVPVPACALLAQIACMVLRQQWAVLDLPPRWKQFLAIAWTLLLIMFLAGHAFRYWRRLQMDVATARLMLQDILWHEIRGEQRRINRWLVWRKLREVRKPEA